VFRGRFHLFLILALSLGWLGCAAKGTTRGERPDDDTTSSKPSNAVPTFTFSSAVNLGIPLGSGTSSDPYTFATSEGASGTKLSFAATDSDNDVLSIVCSDKPSFISYEQSSLELIISSSVGDSGVYTFSCQINDGTIDSSKIYMTLTLFAEPIIISVSAATANGAYKNGDTVDITVTFSTAVSVTTGGGNPTLELETGGVDQTAIYQAGGLSTTQTFRYTVQAADSSSDLNYTSTTALSVPGGSTIRDQSNTDATVTLPALASSNSLALLSAIVIDNQNPNAPMPAWADSSFSNSTTVSFSWTAPSDVGDAGIDDSEYIYEVYDDSCGGTTIKSGSSIAGTAAPLSANAGDGVADGETIYIRMQAKDQAGNTSSWSSCDTLQVDTQAPNGPATLVWDEGASHNATTINFSWTAATDNGVSDIDAAGYSYEVSDASCGGATIKTASSINISASPVQVSNSDGVAFGETIYLRMKATDNAGNSTASWSACQSIDIISPAFTTDWPFDVLGNYTYDNTLIDVAGSAASLKLLDQTDDASDSFSGATHQYTQWSAGNSWVEVDLSADIYPLPSDKSSTGWLDMTSNLVLYHFDEGVAATTFVDDADSGSPQNATCSGASCPTVIEGAGITGNALYFDGAQDVVTLPDVVLTNTFTISIWIKSVSGDAWGAIVRQESNWTGLYHKGESAGGVLSFYYSVDNFGTTAVTRGKWQHIALVNNAGSATFYIDGEAAGTASSAPGFTADRMSHSNDNFNGYMDELALFSTALSPDDIRLIYQKQKPKDDNPWQIDAGWVDETSLTALWHMNGTDGNGISTTDTILDSTGNHNGSASNVDGDGMEYTKGKLKQGIRFDRVDDYINVPDHADFTFDVSEKYSWVFWIRPEAFTTWSTLWSQTIDDADYFFIYIHSVSDGTWGTVTDGISVGLQTTGGHIFMHSLSNVLDTTAWYHVVVTYDGALAQASKFKTFVNGVDETDTGFSQTAAPDTDIDPTSIEIGRNSEWPTELFKGSIDEAAFFSRLLSPTEIQELYDQQSPSYGGSMDSAIIDIGGNVSWTDLNIIPESPSNKPALTATETAYSSGNFNASSLVAYYPMDGTIGSIATDDVITDLTGNYNGTANNNTTNMAYQAGKMGQSIYFAGGDSIDLPNIAMGTTFTIALWVKPVTSGTWGTFFIEGATFEGFYWVQGSSLLTFYSGGNNFSRGALPKGEWVHAALVSSAGSGTFYINGQVAGIISGITAFNADYIGANGAGDALTGNLDELVVWSRALSASELFSLYKRGSLNLKYQIRSCASSTCGSAAFVGPGGSQTTFYSESSNNGINLPSFEFSGDVASNQYFQYRVYFDSDDTTPSFSTTPTAKHLVLWA